MMKQQTRFWTHCALVLSVPLGVLAQTVAVVPAPTAVTTEKAVAACCQQLRGQAVIALPLEKTELYLDQKSPTFDFGQGKQAFTLIELPAYKEAYSFSIRNLLQSPGAYYKASHSQLALRIETLDEQMQSKRVYLHDSMKKRGLGFEKTIFINPQNQAERYVLVYGTLNLEPETITVSKTDLMFVGTGFYIGGADNKLSIKAVDQGVIEIEAKGLLADKK